MNSWTKLVAWITWRLEGQHLWKSFYFNHPWNDAHSIPSTDQLMSIMMCYEICLEWTTISWNFWRIPNIGNILTGRICGDVCVIVWFFSIQICVHVKCRNVTKLTINSSICLCLKDNMLPQPILFISLLHLWQCKQLRICLLFWNVYFPALARIKCSNFISAEKRMLLMWSANFVSCGIHFYLLIKWSAKNC